MTFLIRSWWLAARALGTVSDPPTPPDGGDTGTDTFNLTWQGDTLSWQGDTLTWNPS